MFKLPGTVIYFFSFMFITRKMSKRFPWAKEEAGDLRLQPTSHLQHPAID